MCLLYNVNKYINIGMEQKKIESLNLTDYDTPRDIESIETKKYIFTR